jgi:hypothetical protein
MNIDQLKWLGGFFDAEGSVSFNYKPNVDIVNTCSKTIFHIKFILHEMGIQVGINEREKPSKSSKKPRWDIFLRHEEQIKPFIKIMYPYIFGKKKQIDIIKEWYFYKDENIDYSDKIKFANQINGIIINEEKIQKVKEKLKTSYLDKYKDIPVMNREDGEIIVYKDFNSLSYISGMIDGDGSFCINQRLSRSKKMKRYTPVISIVNTNKEIIKRCCSVLKKYDIGCHISFRVAGKTTNRRRWDILVSGVKRCEKLSSLLESKIQTKKEQCTLLLQYCKYRMLNEKSRNDEIGFECKTALENMKKGQY